MSKEKYSHDHGYKKLFSSPRLLKELLEDFVPEPWVHQVDFSQAFNLSNEFIADGFQLRESDLIWKLPLADSEVYLFLLLEFQSQPDRWMALRILQYIIDLYKRLLKQEPHFRKEKLPSVFPLVLYNGKRKWKSPEALSDLIQATIPPEYIPQFRYYKLAENEISMEKLEKMNSLVSLLFQVENLNLEETSEKAKELVQKLLGKDREDALTFKEWLTYYYKETEHPLRREIDVLKEVEGMLAENIREQQKTWVKMGRQEGRNEGREETLTEIVRRMNANGLKFDIISKATGLSEKEIQAFLG